MKKEVNDFFNKAGTIGIALIFLLSAFISAVGLQVEKTDNQSIEQSELINIDDEELIENAIEEVEKEISENSNYKLLGANINSLVETNVDNPITKTSNPPDTSFPALGSEVIVLNYDDSIWDGGRGGPHNFDVIELNKDGYQYWGYYGTANHDAVGLAFSNDLTNWVRYSTDTPLIDGVGWPTVGVEGNTIHIFYIKGYPTSQQTIWRATSSITDGYNFVEQELIEQNSNNPHDPFIWQNPVDGMWWLLWKEDWGTIWGRYASNIEGLKSAPRMILRTETDSSYKTLASPGVFYWSNNYYMTNEAHPNLWTTRAFYSEMLDAGCFNGNCECSNSPILSNDDACGFPHVQDNRLYYFYSHRVGPGHQWNVKMQASLSTRETPPILTDENPGDGDFGVSLNPHLSIFVEDLQGDSMDIIFSTNATGTWQDIGSYTGANGYYSQTTTNMNEYLTKYWWRVTATDIGGSGKSTIRTFSFTTGSGTAEPWWNHDWKYRKEIAIDPEKVAANLNNFPALIDIVDPDLSSHAQNDGDDIVFVDVNDIKLNHEIEKYDSATGHLIAWVSVDLSSTEHTFLHMYYGNPTVSNQENSEAVWDSNYVMVQHLDETSSLLNWQRYNGNPILDGTKNGFGSTVYDADTSIYHHFCSWGSVLHFTSSDGKNWVPDDANNPVLADAGVPMVWKELDTWYMLYRYGSPLVIGLATSSDGVNWVKYGGNPVLVGDAGQWDDPSYGLDPWGVIKVGSTYYLWYNSISPPFPRSTGLATSTDLMTWNKDPNNPIFETSRYCIFPFKYGAYYYMLVPYYHSFPYGQIELYRCSNPTFYPADREYLGVVINPGPEGSWDDRRFDTPFIFTDTVYRDTFIASNSELWMYYSATGTPTGSGENWWTGMCIEPSISDAVGRFTAEKNVYDSTSNANDGQVIGGVDMNADGYIDGGDNFDGVDSYHDCGDSPSLKGMSALTVETWFKSDAWNNGIISKWGGWTPGTGGSYILYQGSYGNVGWGVITDANYAHITSSAIPKGQWHHCVGVYDGSQISIFMDGVQVGTPASLTGSVSSTNHQCYIGRYSTVRMDGILDEIRVSNIARGASWIYTEYMNQQDPNGFFFVGIEEEVESIPPEANFIYYPSEPTDLEEVQFTDTSTDEDGVVVDWYWEFGDGDTSTLQNPKHQFDDDGIYIVQLTVWDDVGESDSTFQNIEIFNVQPIADFSYSPQTPTDLETINFNDLSYDQDGNIVYWTWDFGDGNNSHDSNPSHQYGDDGIYTISLTVTDDDNAINTVIKQITVLNVPPVSDAGGPYSGTAERSINFNGAGSYDLDGIIVNYEWDFGDGHTDFGEQPSHTYDNPGNFDVTLTVEDNDGFLDTDTSTVEIFTLLEADAHGPYEGIEGIPVDFHGSASEGVPPYDYYWSFGDNVFSHEQNPSHTYDTTGTYKVSLKVTDSRDISDTDHTFALIKHAEELVADAGGPYSGDVDETVQFQGSCIGGTQPYSWYWEFGDGDTSTLQNPTHPYDTSGGYTATLTVTDVYGKTDDDTAQVFIGGHPPNKPTISGSISGKPGTEYEYTFNAVDPDGDNVKYHINWDDGDSDTTAFSSSGTDVIVKHTWSAGGTYTIKATAEDSNGLVGPEGTLSVSMPRNRATLFLQFLQNFLEQHPILYQLLQRFLRL